MSGLSGLTHKKASNIRRTFDISSMIPLPSSQLLNHYCIIHNPLCIEHLKSDVVRPECWHRFTITKESGCQHRQRHYSKIFLLKLITDFVYPHDILPVHVSEKEKKLLFLARNCIDAILKLCNANLLLPNPMEPNCPFSVVIIKDFVTIKHIPVQNIESNIVAVLKKRESRGLLDMTSFHEDKDLQEFCPLSQPKVLLYVLSLASQLTKNGMKLTKISLCKNDIQKLPILESLHNCQFTAIDLSNNKIKNIEDVVPLKDLPHLQWLRLDGNPLCCQFDCGLTYFLYVKTICKNLETLDTKKLCEDGWYKKRRTFLCDTNGFDFADQFVDQYFTYFDQHTRPNIAELYHDNAMFSLTHCSINKVIYPQDKHGSLNTFFYRDRNILLRGSQHGNYLHFGRKDIGKQFSSVIPSIRHNQKSLFVDLMQYTKTFAVISVTGVFKDIPMNGLEEFCCGFTRTFALTSTDGNEWLITNDQWHIYTPYKYKKSLPPWEAVKAPSVFPLAVRTNLTQKTMLTRTLESITGMKYAWAENCLIKNQWDLTRALQDFVEEHTTNDIPDDAFKQTRDNVENVEKDVKGDDVTIPKDDLLPSIQTLLISKPKFIPTPVRATNTKKGVKK